LHISKGDEGVVAKLSALLAKNNTLTTLEFLILDEPAPTAVDISQIEKLSQLLKKPSVARVMHFSFCGFYIFEKPMEIGKILARFAMLQGITFRDSALPKSAPLGIAKSIGLLKLRYFKLVHGLNWTKLENPRFFKSRRASSDSFNNLESLMAREEEILKRKENQSEYGLNWFPLILTLLSGSPHFSKDEFQTRLLALVLANNVKKVDLIQQEETRLSLRYGGSIDQRSLFFQSLARTYHLKHIGLSVT
jgi:hypothetical protein